MKEQIKSFEKKFEFHPESELKKEQWDAAVADMRRLSKQKGYELNAAEVAANLRDIFPNRVSDQDISPLRKHVEKYQKILKERDNTASYVGEAELLQRLFATMKREDVGITSDQYYNKALGEHRKYADSVVGDTDSMSKVERDLWYPVLIALKRMYPEKFKAEDVHPELFETVKYDVQSSLEFLDMISGDALVRMIANCAELFPDKLNKLGITSAVAEICRERLKEESGGSEAVEIAANLKRLARLLNK